MLWIAWKMLIGNRAKYLGIVFGVTFAALLIAQQSSIFCGLMSLTVSQILDVEGAGIWVMDSKVRFVDDVKPMADTDLYRVRGVPGVDWAVRFYKGFARARLEGGDYEQVILLGIDDGTFVGAPINVVEGSLDDLRSPDSIIMDVVGYGKLWPGEPFVRGRTLEMNDRRAVIVGLARTRRTFQSSPVVYSRYTQAIRFAPAERKVMSFVLAEPAPGEDVAEVARRIGEQTGLQALTRPEFLRKTIVYYLGHTGIPLNFAITVALGFLVGTAIAGQTFYLFIVENIRQFGALKAMGTGNGTILLMVVAQAIHVGLVGLGLGLGLAALFGWSMQDRSRLTYFMPWQVLAITTVSVFFIVFFASLLSIRKVFVVDPAIVFRS